MSLIYRISRKLSPWIWVPLATITIVVSAYVGVMATLYVTESQGWWWLPPWIFGLVGAIVGYAVAAILIFAPLGMLRRRRQVDEQR
jgi:uncharacterized membrane protein YeaQ/YmgE (transglycosylase-associated protein family)